MRVERRPKLLVFASGEDQKQENGTTVFPGGSGFETLVRFTRTNPPVLDADVVGVVSNHKHGGVWHKAEKLGIPFHFFDSKEFTAEEYQEIVHDHFRRPDHVTLSGWLKQVHGLDPARTTNIHPALLPHTAGTYGIGAHQKIIQLIKEGAIPPETAINMHFVTEEYDQGPIFFRFPIPVTEDPDDPEAAKKLQQRVLGYEYAHQAAQINRVLRGEVYLTREKLADGSTDLVIRYADHFPKRLYFPTAI